MFELTGPGHFYSLNNYTITGTNNYAPAFAAETTGITYICDALTCTLSGVAPELKYIALFNNTTFNFIGNITILNAGYIAVIGQVNSASGNCTFNLGSNTFTAPVFYYGTAGTLGFTTTINFNSATLNIGIFSCSISTGPTILDMGTSTLNVNGNFGFAIADTVLTGRNWNLNITNTSLINANGNSFNNLNINASGKTITFGTNLIIQSGGSFTLTAGTVSASSYYMIFVGTASITLLANITSPIQTNIAGSTITWNTGSNTWTIPSYVSGDIGTNNIVTWVSYSPGTQYKISAPASVTITYLNVTDCNNIGTNITVGGGTDVNGGNNIGFLWGSNIWSAPSNGNWSTNSNWTNNRMPQMGEDIIFNATSVKNCTVDVTPAAINSLTTIAAFTGTLSFAGLSWSTVIGASFAGTNTVNLGTQYTQTGNGTFSSGSHIASSNVNLAFTGSGSSTLTLTSLATVYGQLAISNGTLTINGNYNTFQTNGSISPLYMNNATLIKGGSPLFQMTGSGTMWTLIGTNSISGYTNTTFNTTALTGNVIITLPTITWPGDAYTAISGCGTATTYSTTFNVTGVLNISCTNICYALSGYGTTIFNYGSYAHTLSPYFEFGTNQVGATSYYNFASGSSIITGGFGGATITLFTYTGPTYFSAPGLSITVTTYFVLPPFVTFTTFNCTLQAAGAGVIDIMSYGNYFTSLNINNTTSTTTYLIDNLYVTGTLTLTASILNTQNHDITCGNANFVGGTLTYNTAGSLIITGTSVTFGSGTTYNTTGAILNLQNSVAVTLNKSITFSRLITSVASINTQTTWNIIIWNTGVYIFTFTSFVAGDIGAIPGYLAVWQSASPGTQYKVSFPSNVTLSNFAVQDCNNVGSTVAARGCRNFKNNIGFTFSHYDLIGMFGQDNI